MAIISKFAFTNTTASSADVNPTNLGMVTNYGPVTSKKPGEEFPMTNTTCPNDQGELVTYRARPLNSVSTELPVMYPARVRQGVEFGARLDEILRSTDETNGFIIQDSPIVCSVAFKAERNAVITEEVLDEVWLRMCGALYDETTGKWRFADLMKNALQPITN